MGKKDITEKNLEAYNDVFADILNVLLFDGKLLVDENELEEDAPRSSYKANGKLHEMERDTAKYWKKFNIRIAFFGLENQTKPHKFMVPRVFGYDGTSYRAQLLDVDDKGNLIHGVYPVVTLVLYFGTTPWNEPTTLYETFEVLDELKPYVNDYKINLFQIAFLSDEKVNMFKSDFKYVADYFVQSRKKVDYVPAPGTIRHVHEVLQLLEALTGDQRFENAINIADTKGANTMGELLLDRMEEKIEKRVTERVTKQVTEKTTKRLNKLNFILVTQGRTDDLLKSATNLDYQKQLLNELVPEDETEE